MGSFFTIVTNAIALTACYTTQSQPLVPSPNADNLPMAAFQLFPKLANNPSLWHHASTSYVNLRYLNQTLLICPHHHHHPFFYSATTFDLAPLKQINVVKIY